MIIALLALAIAMIVGGLLAVFFGWDIVLVERGWTMVIAGSISASSGALLIGIAAAVSKLARIEAGLSRLRDGFAAAEAGDAQLPGSLSHSALPGGLIAGQAAGDAARSEPADEAQPPLPLFDDQDPREGEAGGVTTAEWPESKAADTSILPFPPRTTPVPALPHEDDEPEIKVPDFLLADRDRDGDEEPHVPDRALNVYEREPEDRGPDRHEPEEHEDRREPIAEADFEREQEAEHQPEPEVEHETADATEADEEPAPDEEHPATVIGTYNSGDNKYVMFSDGSIEAQTPSGVFRFKSLDELKEFIAAGGEGDSSASI